ncbi:MAG TPA: hypothetical protein VE912_04475 [Bacteroidales bacterium]|nr:hypothetical protein [Bacteroidales bacterium]
MLKKTIKNILAKKYSVLNYPVVVNSYGRSGSTVLRKSIVESIVKVNYKTIKNIAYRSIAQPAWDLENTNLNNGVVYKTHDYPPRKDFRKDTRLLYTFADPVDVVLSLYRLYNERGEEWMQEHYDHLKVPYTDFKDIIREDQLQLEEHLVSWLNEKRIPIAFVKYEAMWEHQEEISEFLGFQIDLIPFRKRKAQDFENKEIISKIENTYASLREKINQQRDFFTN